MRWSCSATRRSTTSPPTPISSTTSRTTLTTPTWPRLALLLPVFCLQLRRSKVLREGFCCFSVGRKGDVTMPVVKEPCKQQACDIQSCLTKNAFNPERCLQAILNLQKCCDRCENKSAHCASVKPLLKQITKKAEASSRPKA